MKLFNNLMGLSALIAMTFLSMTTNAQDCNTGACATGNCGGIGGGIGDGNCGPRPSFPCADAAPSNDCIGSVGPAGQRYMPGRVVPLGLRDNYAPDRFYPYSSAGLDATRMHHWNGQQAQQNAWHGSYNTWRFGTPTALVVPPTAAFQTEYNWGVGQTRSIPIYAQFGAGGGGGVSGGGGGFYNTPYRPSSTSQFGYYPVRGPW